MSARRVGANGVPVFNYIHRLVSCLRRSTRVPKRSGPGDGNLTKHKESRRDFHPALSVFRANYRPVLILSIMETKELNTAETGKEQESSVHETESTGEVKETCKKRKSEEPERNRRGKKRKKGNTALKPGERYVPPPQKRNPGVSFNQDHFAETSYYFEGGLRKVHPYYFDFRTYCKGRWVGKTLLEVFSSEFRTEPLDYYRKAVKEGRIRLNETPVDDLNITLKVGNMMA